MVAECGEHLRYRVGLQITGSFGFERLREEPAGFVSTAASRITPRELQIGKGLTTKEIERPTQLNDPLLAPSCGNVLNSKSAGVICEPRIVGQNLLGLCNRPIVFPGPVQDHCEIDA